MLCLSHRHLFGAFQTVINNITDIRVFVISRANDILSLLFERGSPSDLWTPFSIGCVLIEQRRKLVLFVKS